MLLSSSGAGVPHGALPVPGPSHPGLRTPPERQDADAAAAGPERDPHLVAAGPTAWRTTAFPGLPYRAALLLLAGLSEGPGPGGPASMSGPGAYLEERRPAGRGRGASMDRAGDAFAALLAGAAEEEPDPVRRRVLEQLLYHLGRWIYLVDAADDLKKGCKVR